MKSLSSTFQAGEEAIDTPRLELAANGAREKFLAPAKDRSASLV